MNGTIERADVLTLSVPERIQLAKDIWDTVTDEPDQIFLTSEQKEELDRRLKSHQLNPSKGTPWSIARERIRSRA